MNPYFTTCSFNEIKFDDTAPIKSFSKVLIWDYVDYIVKFFKISHFMVASQDNHNTDMVVQCTKRS